MMPEGTSSNFSDKARSLMHTLARWFPTPQFLLLRAAGIDISDSSVKWIVITPDENLHKVQSYGSEPLAEGVVVDGAIRNMEALVEILKRVRSKLGGYAALMRRCRRRQHMFSACMYRRRQSATKY